jgi:hypothetical protein
MTRSRSTLASTRSDAAVEQPDRCHEGSWQYYYSRMGEPELGLGRLNVSCLNPGGDC